MRARVNVVLYKEKCISIEQFSIQSEYVALSNNHLFLLHSKCVPCQHMLVDAIDIKITRKRS